MLIRCDVVAPRWSWEILSGTRAEARAYRPSQRYDALQRGAADSGSHGLWPAYEAIVGERGTGLQRHGVDRPGTPRSCEKTSASSLAYARGPAVRRESESRLQFLRGPHVFAADLDHRIDLRSRLFDSVVDQAGHREVITDRVDFRSGADSDRLSQN